MEASPSPTTSQKQTSKFDSGDPDAPLQHSSGPGTPLEGEVMGDCGGLSSADMETIIDCLQELCTTLRTASFTLVSAGASNHRETSQWEHRFLTHTEHALGTV